MTAIFAPTAAPAVIDLSDNNAEPVLATAAGWEALYAAGVRLCIHKLTQGTAHLDPCFAVRRPLALAAGIRFDAYHFFTGDDIDAQLAHFLGAAYSADGEMRLALDFEWAVGGDQVTPVQIEAACTAIDAARPYQPLRYSNPNFNRPGPGFAAGPNWLSKYGTAPTVEQCAAEGWPSGRLVLWQETGSGAVAGLSPIDLSYFNGTLAELAAWPALPARFGVR